MTTPLNVSRIARIFILGGLLLIPALAYVKPAGAIRLIDVKLLFEISDHLSQPSDVAVSKDGRIYIVDGVNSKIRIYTQTGQAVDAFGSPGSNDGQFQNPLGIDVGPSGKVYIADSGNHRIQIFDANGAFIAAIKIPPGPRHPADPTDVAVDETRSRCFIADNDNHRILAYDLATLKQIDTYGTPGSDKLQFRYPFMLALDKEKYIYVVDVINTRVQVLNPDGLFVNFIGAWGVEKGEFYRPKGIALDQRRRIYVSDSWMGVIQIFEPTGDFYATLGDRSSVKVKKFKTPTGIFLDTQSRLYVVEMFANKVSVYRLGEAFNKN